VHFAQSKKLGPVSQLAKQQTFNDLFDDEIELWDEKSGDKIEQLVKSNKSSPSPSPKKQKLSPKKE
jgi:hypothetical protein